MGWDRFCRSLNVPRSVLIAGCVRQQIVTPQHLGKNLSRKRLDEIAAFGYSTSVPEGLVCKRSNQNSLWRCLLFD